MHPELERAEWAVFHGAINDALPLLAGLPDLEGRSAVYALWLQGVALGACGRYGEAFEVVDRIPQGTPEYSMARSLRGSLLRQIGVHDLALHADREAMSSAATPGAAIEAMTGLAADAVGLQDALTATTMIKQGGSLLARVTADQTGASTWWRHSVRLHWVRCEVALLSGEAQEAVGHADAAVAAAEASAAPRHVAKSLLFAGVARIETGERADALPALRRSLMLSTSMGVLAVAWPAHAVLAAVLQQSDPAAAHEHFVQASAITTSLRQGLSGTLATRWDERADIRALHRAAS
jgi:tetratricopeptide (TPR) repeat protein